MPSQMSKLLTGYEEALNESRRRYEGMRKGRYKNAQIFYETFFKNLIRQNDSMDFAKVKMLAEQFFETDEVRFAAVDGSCYKTQLQEYMVFFGASYPIRGTIDFGKSKKQIRYEPWSIEEDVSMVAYVPVPFAELSETLEDPFVVSDEQKIDLSYIHLQLMQLAEIFQAYMLVKSSDLRPRILLWDQSMSSSMNSNDVNYKRISLRGYKYQMRTLTAQDIIIAQSHPYNEDLGVPSKKKFRAYNYILYQLQKKSPRKTSDLAKELNLEVEELNRRMNYLTNNVDPDDPLRENDPLVIRKNDSIEFNKNYEDSWEYVVGLYEHICKKLYKDKKADALIYKRKIADGEEKETWMSPNDLRFLISVGLRALIEECWRYNVLLIGIVKDSSSLYLTRNYLGVMDHIGEYGEIPKVMLPWTDRDFLETLPWIDEKLNAPWSTIEFDSAFMTLHLEDINGSKTITGIRGDEIIPPERLFARSLAQFYLNRSKKALLAGHVIFIDRLLIPKLDKKDWNELIIDQNKERLGIINPIVFLDKDSKNNVQNLMMYILNIVTRNLFPEVIGYPDPLHKADWGAKSLYKKIKPVIDSSNISIRSNPLSKTLRGIRDEVRRI